MINSEKPLTLFSVTVSWQTCLDKIRGGGEEERLDGGRKGWRKNWWWNKVREMHKEWDNDWLKENKEGMKEITQPA